MKIENDKVSSFQFTSVTIALLLNFATLLFPNFLAKNTGSDSFITVVIISILTIVYMFFLTKIIEKKNNIEKSKVALIFMAIFYIIFASIILRFISEMVKIYTLPKTPVSLIMIVTILVCCYGIRGGVEPLIRFTCIIVPIALLFILIPIIMLLPDMRFSNFMPMLKYNSIFDIVESSVLGFLKIVGVEAILILSLSIKNKKKATKPIMIGTFISCIIYILFILVSIGRIGHLAIDESSYPLFNIFLMTDSSTGMVGRYDLANFIFIRLILICSLCLILYTCTSCIKKLIKASDTKQLCYPVGFIVFIVGISFESIVTLLSFFEKYILYFGGVMLIVVPLLAYSSKIKLVVMLLAPSLLFTGCYDSLDINEKIFITGILYEENNEGYHYGITYPDLTKVVNREYDDSTKYITSDIKEFVDIIDDLEGKRDKTFSTDQLRMILLNEDIVKDLKTYMKFTDFINKNVKKAKNFYIACGTDEIENIVEDVSVESIDISNYLYDLFTKDAVRRKFYIPKYNELQVLDISKKSLVFPVVSLNQENFNLDGALLIKNNKNIKLSLQEYMYYSTLINEQKSLEVNTEDISFITNEMDINVSVDVVDKDIIYKIKINAKGNLRSGNGINILNINQKNKVVKEVIVALEEKLNDTFEKCMYNDYLNIDKMIEKYYFDVYNNMNDDSEYNYILSTDIDIDIIDN